MGLRTLIGIGVPMEWHGKLCGVYVGEKKAYYREVDVEAHFCRKYHGWGLQKEVLRDLRARGCRWVVIRVRGQDSVHLAPLLTYFKKGITDTLREQDGEQVFLHASHFEERDILQRTLTAQPSISTAPQPA